MRSTPRPSQRHMATSGGLLHEIEVFALRMKNSVADAVAATRFEGKDPRVIDLFLGVSDDGRPFYAYLAILPERYRAYRASVEAAESVDFAEYGDVIIGGWNEVPPAIVQRSMTEHFGFVHNLEESLP